MKEKPSFNEVCERYGIKVFSGVVMERCTSDICFFEVSDFLDFCRINEIKTVVLSYTYKDDEELDVEQIKHKLRRYFEKKMLEYPFAKQFLPKHITQDYYLSVWSEVVEKLDQEEFIIADAEENDEPTMIEAWAVQSGCRFFAVIYEKEEDNDSSVTEKEVLNKYARLINEKLQRLRADAEIESQRLIKEEEEAVLAEIEGIIKNKTDLINYTTQKARYELADRIQVIFQEERGCDWLMKKQVRSIVDHQYYKLTGKNDLLK